MSNRLKSIDFGLLRAYKKRFGHLKVPLRYVIPKTNEGQNPPWPVEYLGVNIGREIGRIRKNCKLQNVSDEDIDRLDSLGFEDNCKVMKSIRVVNAFMIFDDRHGHCNVPANFVIGNNDESWPKEFRGLRLGHLLMHMRQQPSLYKSSRSVLEEIGVDFNCQTRARNVDAILTALEIHKKINNNVEIKQSYTIPMDDENYPEELRGFPLGHRLYHIQKNGGYSQYKQKFLDIGVSFDTNRPSSRSTKRVPFEDILKAVSCYKNIHGHVNITESFVVSDTDENYPIECRGLALGKRLVKIRSGVKQQSDKRHKLEELGISMTTKAKIPFETIKSAIIAYKIIHGHVKIPVLFVVPEGDEKYPEKTWGMKLGRKVDDIRNHNYWRGHSDEIAELGIVRNIRKSD